MFTARYELIPYIKQIIFNLLKVKYFFLLTCHSFLGNVMLDKELGNFELFYFEIMSIFKSL